MTNCINSFQSRVQKMRPLLPPY
ncbi:hypothetical protein vseg_007421 [Gypsophila vaccaria]